MGAGGPPHRALEAIRATMPFRCMACACRSAARNALDKAHLARFRALVQRYEPALVSEHLAWSTHESVYFNDLLPLPYTEATLATVCDHIDEVQEAIGRPLLLENPSTYVLFRELTMSETDFIRAVARRTGCGLLLDVNNVFVSATNHGFSPLDYLADFPLARGRRNPSRGTCRNRATTRAIAAAHRQPRPTRRRRGLAPVRERRRASGADPDADRMGQRDPGMAASRGGSRPPRKPFSTAPAVAGGKAMRPDLSAHQATAAASRPTRPPSRPLCSSPTARRLRSFRGRRARPRRSATTSIATTSRSA